jgi:hypothetical protein
VTKESIAKSNAHTSVAFVDYAYQYDNLLSHNRNKEILRIML